MMYLVGLVRRKVLMLNVVHAAVTFQEMKPGEF